MDKRPIWRSCGHQKTKENTYGVNSKRKRTGQCRACRNTYSRRWQKTTKGQVHVVRRNRSQYSREYAWRTAGISITYSEYLELLNKQNGVCALCCQEDHDNRALCVDHEHATGRIRGLLCTACNFVLGSVERREKLPAAWFVRVRQYARTG